MNLAKILTLLIEQGGPGSGNYGHAGGKGGKNNPGGSQPTKGLKTGGNGAVMSYGEKGRTAKKRQLSASIGISVEKLDKTLEAYRNKNYSYIIHIMEGLPKSKIKKLESYLKEEKYTPKQDTQDDKIDFSRVVSDNQYEQVSSEDITSNFTEEEKETANAITELIARRSGIDISIYHKDNSVQYLQSSSIIRESVKRLSEKTEMSEKEIDDFIGQWASSSNDHDMRSLSIQEAASEVFDVPLSDYQKEAISYVKNRLEESRTQIVSTYPDLPVDEALKKYFSTYNYDVDNINSDYKGIFDTESNPVIDGVIGKSTISREKEKKVLKAMYEETQSFLDKALPNETHITLYRGISTDESHEVGEVTSFSSNPLESWTLHPFIADGFGDTMVKVRVPKKRILSLFGTGSGTTYEREVVVIGGGKDDKVTVVRYGGGW